MGTNRFRGDAKAVAQQNTVTPASVTVGNEFTVSMNGKDLTFTATDTLVATVVTGLYDLIVEAQASGGEWQDVVATDKTTYLGVGSASAGVPFIQTSSAAVGAGSGTPTLVTATTTASSGPNHWDTALNWSLGTVPVAADDVFIENTAIDILYGIDQNTVALASLNISASYTGKIGLPDYRESSGYYEYREKYLRIRPGVLRVGYGLGGGSGRIKIDTGSSAAYTSYIDGTASSPEDGVPALVLKGSHASNVMNAYQGSIGAAIDAGSTARIPVIRVGYETSPSSDVTLVLGEGCTLGSIVAAGGTIEINSDFTDLTIKAGETSVKRAASCSGDINVFGGTVWWMSSGSIADVPQIAAGAKLDFTRDLRARSITGDVCLEAGGALLDTSGTVTWPAAPNGLHIDCDLTEVTLSLGRKRIWTPTAY